MPLTRQGEHQVAAGAAFFWLGAILAVVTLGKLTSPEAGWMALGGLMMACGFMRVLTAEKQI